MHAVMAAGKKKAYKHTGDALLGVIFNTVCIISGQLAFVLFHPT
jgi:hypothetical protein